MKLIRIKITDPKGFRSLQADFEHHFRKSYELEKELESDQGFSPFVCAGPNGSGKSNLLEVLGAIFFQLEILRVRRSYLPANFVYDDVENPNGYKEGDGTPNAFELEYLIKIPDSYHKLESKPLAQVKIIKTAQSAPQIIWKNKADFEVDENEERDLLLPDYIVGYSSGENEILSLPFFKMRFIQYDEYWNSLIEQLPYPGRPETRLAYLDTAFSQAILLCNLLFQDDKTLKPFKQYLNLEKLESFRIIIRREIEVSATVAAKFGRGHPALIADYEANVFSVDLMQLLEARSNSPDSFRPIVTRLKNCATCSFVDQETQTLYLDYLVNDETKKAFRANFDYEENKSPIALFQAFQVLLTLNLFGVSDKLKKDLYQSNSHYVSETVPVVASDERVMRFKFVEFKRDDVAEPLMLKDLSDGEHQLLHSLGLSLLFKGTNTLFLLDEPETHFNPDWRSNFISCLRQCFADAENTHEMLISTHTPFLISDSHCEKVMEFWKDNGEVKVRRPEYETFGASINKITMKTFHKGETIGSYANSKLSELRARFNKGEDKMQLLNEINNQLGDSIEKILLLEEIENSEAGEQ